MANYRRLPDFEETVENSRMWANIVRRIRPQRVLLAGRGGLAPLPDVRRGNGSRRESREQAGGSLSGRGCARRRGSSGRCSRGRVRKTRGSTGQACWEVVSDASGWWRRLLEEVSGGGGAAGRPSPIILCYLAVNFGLHKTYQTPKIMVS